MYSTLNIGKTGLKAMQFKMDAVADELANVNTNGYKRKDISFQELLNNQIYDEEVLLSDLINYAEINVGSKGSVGKINFNEGNLLNSPFDYHLSIEGKGFFGVIDQNNNLMLTRNGGFHLNHDNTISDDSGYPLVVNYNVPIEEWNNDKVSISTNGDITTSEGESRVLGKIMLFYPENLDSLTSMGEGRYLPSENVELYNSIDQGELFGSIIQYSLEGSNVEIISSMSEMISTQRAYSLNAKAIQTTDDMMQMINGIKR